MISKPINTKIAFYKKKISANKPFYWYKNYLFGNLSEHCDTVQNNFEVALLELIYYLKVSNLCFSYFFKYQRTNKGQTLILG